jgi:hypothetical protein
MRIRGSIALMALIVPVGMSLVGCGGPIMRESNSMVLVGHQDPGIIGVVPFFAIQPDSSGRRLARCPRCEQYMVVGEILPEAPATVTGLFRQKLISSGYSLASEEIIAKALPAATGLEATPEALAQSLGLEANLDTVLLGWVFRYSERIGNAWGVQKPASVAFVVQLFDGKKGTLLWRGKFDETQQPLSADILGLPSFLRRGGRWLTAGQLAADGVSLVLSNFPGMDQVRVNR